MSNSGDRIDANLYARFRSLIAERTGIVLRQHAGDSECTKLQNRLNRPLKQLGLTTFEQLWGALNTSKPESREWTLFVHAVSTHKTEFFREPAHFQHLGRHAVALWKRNHSPVNVWSAACSTGEEAVSAAITLANHSGSDSQATSTRFQILATDLDSVVVETAKNAIYPKPDLPTATLRDHFLEGTGDKASLVRVKDHLRAAIRYDQFNLLEPNYPAHKPFDAILCRNVLIYFTEQTRDRIVTKLTEALAPGGLLFLGHSESFSYREDLECVAPTVYRNKRTSAMAQRFTCRGAR